ncbi:hypothetical protein ACSVDA_22030 [Cytobacillus sp. Hm23]
MKIARSILVYTLVILSIIALYIGIFSFFIFILSLIPVLDIKIDSWTSVFIFSICIILWVIPYELINFLQDIPTKSRSIKNILMIIASVLSVTLFTLYILFLERKINYLSISDTGIVFLIITVFIIFKLIIILDKKIEKEDKMNE